MHAAIMWNALFQACVGGGRCYNVRTRDTACRVRKGNDGRDTTCRVRKGDDGRDTACRVRAIDNTR